MDGHGDDDRDTSLRLRRGMVRKLGVVAKHRGVSMTALLEEEFGPKLDRLYRQTGEKMTAEAKSAGEAKP